MEKMDCPSCHTQTDVDVDAIAESFRDDSGGSPVFCQKCGGQLPHPDPDFRNDEVPEKVICPNGHEMTFVFGCDVNLLPMDLKGQSCPQCGISYDSSTWRFI